MLHLLYTILSCYYFVEETTSQEASDENKTKEDKDDKEEEEEGEVKEGEVKHFPRADEDEEESRSEEEERGGRPSTDPPESQFVLLGPSRNRYTILKDEF